jgi:SAM-dependent methyltransferase
MSMTMTTGAAQYDPIARQYQRTKDSPLRRHIEAWTLDRLLGPVAGLAVLDVGCGDGWYARRLKDAGAVRVLGVDVSSAMVALARAAESDQPRGIPYIEADAAALPAFEGGGAFDLALGAYLLHYAASPDQLRAMAAGLAANLKPDGRLVALVENPDQDPADYHRYGAYGFDKSVTPPRQEGSPITYSLVSGRELIRFQVWYWSRSRYEDCLAGAGFTDIAWHPLMLDPAEAHNAYWQDYLANPPVLGLTARRRAS